MSKTSKKSLTYADAGVDIHAGHDTKNEIGKLVKTTYTDKVVGGFGQFGGMFDVSFVKEYDRPVLVSSVDGVGTKLKIAFEMGIHDTVGEDIINHCVDDILVLGARPLFFLDYIASGKMLPEIIVKVVEGLARGCRGAGCVLIGGETAEMPGFYKPAEYDIAGTIVGVVDAGAIVDGSRIRADDAIIGLRSNGLHTNGYSLARKIITGAAKKKYTDLFKPAGTTFGEELLRVHRSYLPVLPLLLDKTVRGCAHLTGGGFQHNIDRVLPKHLNAVIDTRTWVPDPIFRFLQQEGNVENDEMYRTFNMGIGMVLVVDRKDADAVCASAQCAPFNPVRIGAIKPGNGIVELEYGR